MIVTAIVAGALAYAIPVKSSICAKLNEEIEESLKEVASLLAEGYTDKSVSKAAMRGAQQAAEYARIQANIDLQTAHRCAPLAFPIGPWRYITAAVECNVASTKQPGSVPDVCRRAAWAPLTGK